MQIFNRFEEVSLEVKDIDSNEMEAIHTNVRRSMTDAKQLAPSGNNITTEQINIKVPRSIKVSDKVTGSKDIQAVFVPNLEANVSENDNFEKP